MSRMKSLLKPPLAKSPTRLRPRPTRIPTSIQTPPGSLTKSLKPNRGRDMEEPEIRPEYMTISCELRALAKRVSEELGDGESERGLNLGVFASARVGNSSPLFERGRFYEEYSARRNERLKRKKIYQKGEESNGKASTPYNLGVTMESAKRGSTRKIGSVRKSISGVAMETPRYMLRSMSKKENKKPPLPLYADQSVARRLKKAQY